MQDFPDDLITVPEAAQLLRVSTKSVTRWLLAGRVRAWRVGRRYRLSRTELLERAMDRVSSAPCLPTRRELDRRERNFEERVRRLGLKLN